MEPTDAQIETLKKHTIVAIDVDTIEEARALVKACTPFVDKFKIGSRMFTAHGPAAIDAIAELGGRVFLDLKFHDIPSVVGSACRAVAERHPSVFLLTIHASGGAAMISHAVEGASARSDLRVISVTALTSLSPAETGLLGIGCSMQEWTEKLGELALEAGAHGLVSSAREVENLRASFGPDPILVTPGIRPTADPREAGDDQARVQTPKEGIERGSSYLVIGRPIYHAPDPSAKLREIAASL